MFGTGCSIISQHVSLVSPLWGDSSLLPDQGFRGCATPPLAYLFRPVGAAAAIVPRPHRLMIHAEFDGRGE
jgi:hypothetical protein